MLCSNWFTDLFKNFTLDNLFLGLSVAAIGIVFTFLVLALLILIFTFSSYINRKVDIYSEKNKDTWAENKAKKLAEKENKQNAKLIASGQLAPEIIDDAVSNDTELVAVIMSAITICLNEENTVSAPFRIRSITKLR